MPNPHNPIGWVEIPVTDLTRAATFYETVLKIDIQKVQFGNVLMGWFPTHENGTGTSGTLIQYEEAYKPSDTHGPLIYFTCKDLSDELARVDKAGGKIVQAKTQISEEIGFMALLIDTEGNRIALHSKA